MTFKKKSIKTVKPIFAGFWFRAKPLGMKSKDTLASTSYSKCWVKNIWPHAQKKKNICPQFVYQIKYDDIDR